MTQGSDATADVAPRPSPHEGHPQPLGKVVIAAGAGHFVEWFDFGLYGTLATAISLHFFKAGDTHAALLSAFAVFGAGFVMRPLGGLFFGSMGDRLGRRTTLALVVLITSVATALMGVLPTWQNIGVIAPILLVILRLVQGFAAGGESSGATALLAEYAPPNRRGFVSSFVDVFGFLAFVVGAGLVLAFTALLGEDALNSWGWRALFLVAVPLGLVSLYLRMKLEDTPEFRAVKEKGKVVGNPLRTSLQTSWKALLFCVCFVVVKAVGHWTLQTFMPSYLQTELGYSAISSYGALVIGLLFIMLMVPLFGLLSDTVGRRPVMIAGCAGFIVFTYPTLTLMSSGHFLAAAGALIILGVFMAAFDGAMSAAMAELFPTNIRYGSMAIAYNISVAVFGGITPFFATFLITSTGNTFAPAFYVMAAALVTLIAVLRARETYDAPLAIE
ncbi:MFS transporter [Brachybacterium sacelli]|uniref:MHS family proline/betaine transporter-like MFS transporter n=1 Tax=Brachybacterium sacelli TaxID=173364 RepID=A0ABS4WYQ5_9MICO|nr:MFS transporter [Brachybacterium sacelli]MBP2381332.1 MHS family proline/betaine transporter-like MFS transporter [Brachybacterium sacelli]